MCVGGGEGGTAQFFPGECGRIGVGWGGYPLCYPPSKTHQIWKLLNCIIVILINFIEFVFRKNLISFFSFFLSFPFPGLPVLLFFPSFLLFSLPPSFFSPFLLSVLPFFSFPLLFLFFPTLHFSRSVGWFSRWAVPPCPPGCYATGLGIFHLMRFFDHDFSHAFKCLHVYIVSGNCKYASYIHCMLVRQLKICQNWYSCPWLIDLEKKMLPCRWGKKLGGIGGKIWLGLRDLIEETSTCCAVLTYACIQFICALKLFCSVLVLFFFLLMVWGKWRQTNVGWMWFS